MTEMSSEDPKMKKKLLLVLKNTSAVPVIHVQGKAETHFLSKCEFVVFWKNKRMQ